MSQTFKVSFNFNLTKIYRQQKDNPLLDLLTILRDKPIYKFNEIHSDFGNLSLYNNWRSFIDKNIELFRDMVAKEDPTIVKLIVYTNKRVEAFNQVIRQKIFNNDQQYNIGDILMGYDSCDYQSTPKSLTENIVNSSEYIVKDLYKTTKLLYGTTFNGFNLLLYSIEDGTKFDVFMLSNNNKLSDIETLTADIELLRLSAISANSPKQKSQLWRNYFKLTSSFVTPCDLYYNGRVVKKKSLDYAYALSSHKSQGSNYSTILVDMDNLFLCQRKEEVRQLQYVALSRTRKDIHMLIK